MDYSLLLGLEFLEIEPYEESMGFGEQRQDK